MYFHSHSFTARLLASLKLQVRLQWFGAISWFSLWFTTNWNFKLSGILLENR